MLSHPAPHGADACRILTRPSAPFSSACPDCGYHLICVATPGQGTSTFQSGRSVQADRIAGKKLAGSSLQFSQSRLNKKLMLILQLVTCACWALPAPLKDNRDVGTRTTTQAGSFGSYFFDCVCCLTVPAFQAAAANALQAMIPPLSHLWTNLCQSPQLQPFARVETRRFHRVLTLKRLASG